MKKFVFLLWLLVGFFFVRPVFAETIPATPENSSCAGGYWWRSGAVYTCTAQEMCTALFNPSGFTSHTSQPPEPGNIRCMSFETYQIQEFAHTFEAVRYTCPANGGWTLQGTQCTRPDCAAGTARLPDGSCACPSGQYKENGVCKCENGSQTGTNGQCCPAPGDGGGAPMQWCYVEGPSSTSCNAGGNNGCSIRCKDVTFQTGTGDHLAIYPKIALGQNCGYTGLKTPPDTPGGGALTDDELNEVKEATKTPEVAKTPGGCLAAGQGYITSGGVTTCVSSGEAGDVKETKTTQETSTVKNPGTGADETTTKETTKTESTTSGGQKSGTTTETVTNPNGTKTITTTTRTQNPDGTVTESKKVETVSGGTTTTQSNSTGTQGQGTYCEKNPNDPICKKPSDDCIANADRLGCMGAGTPPVEGALQSQQIGVSSISTVAVSQDNQCPAGLVLPHGLGEYNWGPACQLASVLKPIVLAFAWISAIFIVFGFKGQE
jgi:hypothetical protein